jgi:hypothetical protein
MNTLESRVLDLIGENSVTPDVFDATGIAEIRSHLNDAIEEICMITGCHRRQWHIPLKASTFFYSVPSGRGRFGWFEAVYLVGQKRVLTQESWTTLFHIDARWLYATGSPTHYVPFGHDQFAIYPTPTISTDMLEITGVAVPDRYDEDTDRIRLRKSFEWAAVNRAVSEFWATRGDPQSAARYFQAYAQEVGYPQLYPEQYERRWQFRQREK